MAVEDPTPTPAAETPPAPAPAPAVEPTPAPAPDYSRHEAALAAAFGQLQQERQARLTLEQMLRQRGAPAPPGPTDEQLEELGRINPVQAYRHMQARERMEQATRQELRDRAILQQARGEVQGQERFRQAADRVASEWPEAYDPSTPLHQAGAAIYYGEMTEQDRARPDGFLHAVERAAGRIGLGPRSTRGGGGRDVAGQAAERGGRRPRAAGAEPGDEIALTAKEEKLAAEMEIDPKLFKARLAARRNAK